MRVTQEWIFTPASPSQKYSYNVALGDTAENPITVVKFHIVDIDNY